VFLNKNNILKRATKSFKRATKSFKRATKSFKRATKSFKVQLYFSYIQLYSVGGKPNGLPPNNRRYTYYLSYTAPPSLFKYYGRVFAELGSWHKSGWVCCLLVSIVRWAVFVPASLYLPAWLFLNK